MKIKVIHVKELEFVHKWVSGLSKRSLILLWIFLTLFLYFLLIGHLEWFVLIGFIILVIYFVFFGGIIGVKEEIK